MIVPLKYLSNFCRTLEMPLITCEDNLVLTWSSTCVITNSTSAGIFAITDPDLYVPAFTLSTQDNQKLLQQLKSGFQRTIKWNLNHLVDPSFQGANRLFVLSFERDGDRT